MKKKLFLLPLLMCGMMGLSSCTLFNDDDIKVVNNYNPPSTTPEIDPDATIVQDVVGKYIDTLPNIMRFKSICYANNETIENTYKTSGVNHLAFNVNQGNDYFANKSSNNYDLYVPDSVNKNNSHTVILFIHGGAWVSGWKTDVNEYVQEFAKRGYITATIKYTLLKRAMNDASLSIFRNLDEIDACIKSIKTALEELEFDTSKTNLAIGGASSGAHLAMLYSYSRGNHSALPIRFVIDAVGPVDIKQNAWKAFANPNTGKEAGITETAIASQSLVELPIAGEGVNWNEYQTMKIANGMCGIPNSLSDIEASADENKEHIAHPNAASHSITDANGGEDQLSVTYWLNKGINSYPIICAYAGMDSIVGINQYATLHPVLENLHIQNDFIYFKDCDHTDIKPEKDAEAYTTLINTIDNWCNALSV